MWQIDTIRSFQYFVAFSKAVACRAGSRKEAVAGLQLYLKDGRRRPGCLVFAIQEPGYHSFEKGAYPLPAHAHPRDAIEKRADHIS